MPTEKYYRAVIPDGTRPDDSRDTPGAYRGTLRDGNNRLAGQLNLEEVELEDQDSLVVEYGSGDVGSSDEASFAGVLAGLALVGLAIGTVAVVGAARDKKARRRESTATSSEVQVALTMNAPAGWYEAGSGRQRWWDGQRWTDHFQSDPRHAPAPAGWYDDGSGRQRWWDGFEWTAHFQAPQSLVAAPVNVTSGSAPSNRSHDVDISRDLPQLRMSSQEWQQRVRAMLLARAISEQQWRLLSVARIEDADKELLEWQQQLAGLTPQQFSDQLNLVLESDPSLAGASLQLAQAGWYDDGSGRDRWWDGREWTDRYRAETMKVLAGGHVVAPAGLYDDGSGRQRWWDGQQWT